jgi:limonene-1,2-epoxide hydrolase
VETGAAAAAVARETVAALEVRVHASEADAARALAERDEAVVQVGAQPAREGVLGVASK